MELQSLVKKVTNAGLKGDRLVKSLKLTLPDE